MGADDNQVVTMPPVVPAMPVGVGIIGFGASARIFHAPLIAAVPGLHLTGFLERSSTRGAAAWPGTTTWQSLEAMLDNPGVQVVVICSPNATHYSLARTCLLAGRHVVVEKPFTLTLAEADELCALARQLGRVLTVFHNRRLDGDYLTLRQVLRQGTLGRVVEARLVFERWAPDLRPKAWKEAGSEGSQLLDDLGSHLVDQAMGLWGRPQTVWCRTDCQREHSRAEDSFLLVLDCGGIRVVLSAGLMMRLPAPRFAVHGTRGSFIVHGVDPQEAQLASGMSPRHVGYGLDGQRQPGVLDVFDAAGQLAGPRAVELERGRYADFYVQLLLAVQGQGPAPVPPEEAAMVMQVLEAARNSARTGNTITL